MMDRYGNHLSGWGWVAMRGGLSLFKGPNKCPAERSIPSRGRSIRRKKAAGRATSLPGAGPAAFASNGACGFLLWQPLANGSALLEARKQGGGYREGVRGCQIPLLEEESRGVDRYVALPVHGTSLNGCWSGSIEGRDGGGGLCATMTIGSARGTRHVSAGQNHDRCPAHHPHRQVFIQCAGHSSRQVEQPRPQLSIGQTFCAMGEIPVDHLKTAVF